VLLKLLLWALSLTHPRSNAGSTVHSMRRVRGIDFGLCNHSGPLAPLALPSARLERASERASERERERERIHLGAITVGQESFLL
jgi:hypothetical protein